MNDGEPMMEFRIVVQDSTDIKAVRELFLAHQDELGFDFCFQGFQEELDTLPGKYVAPNGQLLLVTENGVAIACGALRDLGSGACEVKRIYVRPEARRRGLARQVSERLIEFATRRGYRFALLDTMRKLTGAIALYQQLGFDFTEPYNDNAGYDIVYMRKDLRTGD